MKFIILTVLIQFLTVSSFAQKNADSTVPVVAYFVEGDIVKYSYSKTNEKTRNGKTERTKEDYFIEIEVAEETDSGSYIIHWKYQGIKNIGDANDPTNHLYGLIDNMVFTYRINELGGFEELLNWTEIHDIVEKSIDALTAKITDSKLTDKVVNEMKRIFSTRESIEEVIMKDVQWFHSLYGGEYTKNEIIEGETELVNVLGGPPFPAKLTIEMTALDEEYCTIKITQEPEPATVTKVITEWLTKTSGKKEDISIPALVIKDVSEFIVERESGWINQLMFSRTAQIDSTKNHEITTIKRLD